MQFVPAVEADALIKNMKTKFLDGMGLIVLLINFPINCMPPLQH